MELSKITCFAANYIKSMRLYYSFVTGVAGWVGVSLVSNELTPRALIALAILFSAWGVNQIINDYLGLPEDRINAPNRPMVSGELNINWALALSGVLIVISTTIAWWFSPISAVFLIIGVLLNVAYEYSKAIPIVANLVFGVMIAQCFYFGLAFMNDDFTWLELFEFRNLILFIGISLTNAVMTFFTYFKDYEGDRQAGKKTMVVWLGQDTSRRLGIFLALVPFLALIPLFATEPGAVMPLLFLLTISLGFSLLTAFLYFKSPKGTATYFNLKWNFVACTTYQAALIAITAPALATTLIIVSAICIPLLFSRHKDARA